MDSAADDVVDNVLVGADLIDAIAAYDLARFRARLPTASLAVTDNEGNTLLHLATVAALLGAGGRRADGLDMLAALADTEIDADLVNDETKTAFVLAAEAGDAELVRIMAELGLDSSMPTALGETALHRALGARLPCDPEELPELIALVAAVRDSSSTVELYDEDLLELVALHAPGELVEELCRPASEANPGELRGHVDNLLAVAEGLGATAERLAELREWSTAGPDQYAPLGAAAGGAAPPAAPLSDEELAAAMAAMHT